MRIPEIDRPIMNMRVVALSAAMAVFLVTIAVGMIVAWLYFGPRQPPSVPIPPDDIGLALKQKANQP